MNKKILLIIAVLASAALSARANLVTNPGFETGDFTGWTQWGDTSFTGVSSSVPIHSGNFAAYFGPTSTDGGIDQNIAGTVAGRAAKFCCAAPATPVLATQVATPPTAAPFRNFRRLTRLFLDFFMAGISSWALCVLPAVCVEGSPRLAALYPSLLAPGTS